VLNDRLAAAQSVASHLGPTENSIEEAIVSASRLAISIVEGRRSARLPIDTGQESLAAVAKTSNALIEARSLIAQAHAALAEEKVKIGLGARSMGDWGECPDNKALGSGEPSGSGLKIVA
jgi:hypothetical protein